MCAGLEKVGIETVFAHDIHRTTQALYVDNWVTNEFVLGDIRAVNEALQNYPDGYHEVRPHQALGWLTPNQFRDTLGMAA